MLTIITLADAKHCRFQNPGDRLLVDHDRIEVAPGQFAGRGEHSWEVGGRRFLTLKVSARVTVHFESGGERSRDFGPYSCVWIVDSVMLDGVDEDVPLATFDRDSREWFCPRGGRRWERVVVTASPQAPVDPVPLLAATP